MGSRLAFITIIIFTIIMVPTFLSSVTVFSFINLEILYNGLCKESFATVLIYDQFILLSLITLQGYDYVWAFPLRGM